MELLLQNNGQQATGFLIRGLHDEMKALAWLKGIAGLLQQCSRFVRIVGIGLQVAVKGPVLWRKNAGCLANGIAPEVLDDRSRIDRIGNCLTDANITEHRIAQIKAEILKWCSGLLLDFQRRIMPKRADHVSTEGIDVDI